MRFTAVISSGNGGYTYTWFLNGSAVATTYFYDAGTAGNLYLVVKDAAGKTAQTNVVAVSMILHGCDAGGNIAELAHPNTYYSPLADQIIGLSNLPDSTLNVIGYNRLSGFVAKNHGESHTFSCFVGIARLFSPTANPGSGTSQDGWGYTYTGGSTFKCQNRVWVYQGNNCQWIPTGPAPIPAQPTANAAVGMVETAADKKFLWRIKT